MENPADRFMDELRNVIADAEELLRVTADQAGPKVQEVRARAEESLRNAREHLQGAGKQLDSHVRAEPVGRGRRRRRHRRDHRHPDGAQMTTLLESAQNLIAGLLDIGRTRFELFSTELREELARLAVTLIGGVAILILALFGIGFAAIALILAVAPEYRLATTIGVALFFFALAGIAAWWLNRASSVKPRAFDATLSELQRDVTAIKP